MYRTTLILLFLLTAMTSFSLTNSWGEPGHSFPKHEVRAVWLTTIGGIDWPHSYAQGEPAITKQKRELCQILDKLKRANINTVLLQARVRATTIFPTNAESGNEPWDGCLSGVPGKSPNYDALQFAIDECHRRGMELHAWVVTIPLGRWNGLGCKQLYQKNPKLVMKIGDSGFMNPAEPQVATYLARYCADITRRYDIDGIHLDYIRYPEEMKRLPKADEGRRNITRIVKAIHDAVKVQKPWVKMSCSPVGKHDDTRRFWSHGWNARSRVFQDAKEWMRLGYMDQEYPMMYFRGNNFYPFAIDWKEGCYGKMMVPGLGIYFMHPKEGNWQLEDITREMYVLREQGMGICFFRSKFFTDNTRGIYDFVTQQFNLYPSLIPAMSSTTYPAPSAPTDILVKTDACSTTVCWKGARDNSDGDYLIYNIYASDSYPVDVTDARNLMSVHHYGTQLVHQGASFRYYAITAVDRYGQESAPCQMRQGNNLPQVRPAWYYITHPLG